MLPLTRRSVFLPIPNPQIHCWRHCHLDILYTPILGNIHLYVINALSWLMIDFSHHLDSSKADYKLNILCLQHILPYSTIPLTCICIHYIYISPHSNLHFLLSSLTSHSSLYYMLMWPITSSHVLLIVAYFPLYFSLSTIWINHISSQS